MPAGDPDTRPDGETVFVPSSHELDRDARDWESCALVPWAIHLPRGDGARAIEELLVEQLRLQPRDVTVLVHQPEPYLIRFERSEHCRAARDKGRFRGRGIDICLRPWRSLTHAIGMRIFYRVRLCLDGIPIHAWTPDIVERVIDRRCALQCINTDLVQPRDSRHIDLWAWTADPSEIPKKVWLFFTNGPTERSSAVFVSTKPQEFWHQGARFQVFLHMPVIEDYSAVANNLQAAVDNPAAVVPLRRYFDWRYGLPDGAPPGARPAFPARLPRPPAVPAENDDGRRDADGSRGIHGAHTARGKEREDRGVRDTRDTRVPRGGERDERVDRGRRPTRPTARSSSSRNSCKGMDFQWPTCQDDDDDDYDHPGRGRDTSTGFNFFPLEDTEPVRRERMRSPRRRDGGFWRRRGWNNDHPDEAWRPHRDDDDALPAGRVRLHAAGHHTTEVSYEAPAFPHTQMQEDQNTVDLAYRFAARLGSAGNDAWSVPAAEDAVPAGRVFSRLKSALSTPTVQEVDLALQAIQLAAAAVQGSALPAAAVQGGIHIGGEAFEASADGPLGPAQLNDAGLLGLHGDGPASMVDGPGDTDAGPAVVDQGVVAQEDGPTHNRPRDINPDMAQQQASGAEAPAGGHGPVQRQQPASVDEFFTTPSSPLLNRPPVRATRKKRTFDISTVRRSSRLANRKAMPSMQRAQNNLLRKLGLQVEEKMPIETVLKEYIQSVKGPLPDYVVAALATMLDLDDEESDKFTEALMQHAGDGIIELQEEQEGLLVRDE
ncbi:unnamed protein product [Urochloa humidicola]